MQSTIKYAGIMVFDIGKKSVAQSFIQTLLRRNITPPKITISPRKLGVETTATIFSERELMFMFAICRRPSVCLSSVCLSSVTLVHPTQAIEIFGNVSTPFGTLAICDLSVKILRRSSQGNPSGEGLNQRVAAKYSDFGHFQGYISETVQDRS